MYCQCFKNILTKYSPEFSSTQAYLEFEISNCLKIKEEIAKKNLVSSILHLNTSYLTTEIKLKNDNCTINKYQLNCLYIVLSKHWETLNILENEVNKAKQQTLKIEVPKHFQHFLTQTNTISDYIKCVKIYIYTKSSPLRIYGNNIHSYSTDELKIENKNHLSSLKFLQLFSSFKEFYSADFEQE